MKRSIILSLLLVASSIFALSPPPEGFKEKSLEDVWNESEEVLYGKVTELKLIEGTEPERSYWITIRVERLWKGENIEKKVFIADLPLGDGSGHHFQLGVSYAVFLAQNENMLYPLHAMPIRIPAGQFEQLFENQSSDQPTGDGYTMKDKWKLRQFLNSKDHSTLSSNQAGDVNSE